MKLPQLRIIGKDNGQRKIVRAVRKRVLRYDKMDHNSNPA